MRGLERNKTGFFYALFEGEADAMNAEFKRTGGKVKQYSTPVYYRANISPANGVARTEPFGKDTRYTHVIYTSGNDCPITEESVLWIYEGLNENSDLTDLVSNYVVTGIFKSMNETKIAILKKGVEQRGGSNGNNLR